jgi:hypothetical protein
VAVLVSAGLGRAESPPRELVWVIGVRIPQKSEHLRSPEFYYILCSRGVGDPFIE